MVNSDNETILNEIVNSVAKVYQWKNFYKPVIKHLDLVKENSLHSYTGKYLWNGDTVNIVIKGGHLFIDYGYMQWQLFFTSPADFFAYEYGECFQFVKTEAGTISGIKVGDKGYAKKIDDLF
jgi:hypothetical protein